jgi:methylated-DNA-[protein]-cysteine S-methyltransferase
MTQGWSVRFGSESGTAHSRRAPARDLKRTRAFENLAIAVHSFLFYSPGMLYAFVETDLGRMGLGWTERGLARLSLPGGNLVDRVTRWGLEGEPGGAILGVVERVRAYASGIEVSFDEFDLDLSAAPEFHRQAYAHIRRLRWGQTTTYGEVARGLGDSQLSRAVGQAMAANPIPLIVPCHRVLGAGGRSGGFSAPGGVTTKMKMLAMEQASAPGGQYAFAF